MKKTIILSILINIANSIVMASQTVVLQRMFDSILEVEKRGFLIHFLLFCVIMLLGQAVNGALNLSIEHNSYLMTEHNVRRLNKKVSGFAPVFFDSEENLNLLQRAKEGTECAVYVFNVFCLLISYYIPYFLFMTLYLGRIHKMLVILIPLVFFPTMFSTFLRNRRYEQAEEETASLKRRYLYYSQCLNDLSFAGETRILRAQNFFLTRLLKNVLSYNDAKIKVTRDTNLHEIRMKGITLAGYIAAILLLVKGVFDESISAGVFAAVFASLNTMFGIMEELVCSQMGVIAENKPNIDCYRKLMKLSPEQNGTPYRADVSLQSHEGEAERGTIEMRQVSFSYPGSDRCALDHVDICIQKGEMLAVVGENGAGKSTFAKVLLGLYQPTSGEVCCDGKNIAYLYETDLSKKISAVMQDFGKYSMTVNENVAFEKYPSEERMDQLLDEVGMLSVVRQLGDGKNTVLSRRLGGTDLSGGQWQRLAIARGYYRDAQLLILDEPTSAIDPKFEQEIYDLFRRMAKGRTAIIITHRLAMAKDADRILLFDRGRIAECGNHEMLMKQGGKYAYMYEMQKENYR